MHTRARIHTQRTHSTRTLNTCTHTHTHTHRHCADLFLLGPLASTCRTCTRSALPVCYIGASISTRGTSVTEFLPHHAFWLVRKKIRDCFRSLHFVGWHNSTHAHNRPKCSCMFAFNVVIISSLRTPRDNLSAHHCITQRGFINMLIIQLCGHQDHCMGVKAASRWKSRHARGRNRSVL